MNQATGTLDETLASHRDGRLEEAEQCYGWVLEKDPRNARLWHRMGRLALGRGDWRSGAARLLQAIRLQPDVSEYHTSLAEAFAAQHRWDEAMRCCREALRVSPGYVPALLCAGDILYRQERYREACTWYWRAIRERPECAAAFGNLGNALHALGEHVEAASCYREAFALSPGQAVHAVNLAGGLMHLGLHEEAEHWARRALALQPDLAEALSNLSLALAAQDRLSDAEALARRAVAQSPSNARFRLNLGNLLLRASRFAEAEAEFRTALQLQPSYPRAANNLAVALHQQDREDEAAAWCEQLCVTLPQFSGVWMNLGIVRQAQGMTREAISCFDEVLRRQPDDAAAHVSRALCMLAEGYLGAGFAEYEWRWKLAAEPPRAAALPPWNGEPLEGRTILLWAEQGLGDTVQFARYVPLVAALGGRAMVECPDCLAGLVESVAGVSGVIAPAGPLPAAACQAPLMSLPRLAATIPEEIPNAVPYLTAGRERVARCRARLGEGRSLRVGLAWSGNPIHINDNLRSIPLARMAALRRVPGVEWHSLQVEERDSDEGWREGGWLHRSMDEPRCAASLAALMCCLDLVVTVDSMAAHLAGALGRPVWTLLARVPDWRWRMKGETTPWYPTMRLFRQKRAGDWEEVLERVAEELRSLAQSIAHAADKEQ